MLRIHNRSKRQIEDLLLQINDLESALNASQQARDLLQKAVSYE